MKKTTKEKFVTTIQNKKLPISKTRSFNKKYYEVGDNLVENSGDCYLMEDGKYYRVETGHIVYNVSKKRYVFASSLNLAKGIINSDLEEGYFDYDFENNVEIILKDNKSCLGISKDIIENNLEFRECINTGAYFHISQKKALELLQKKTPPPEVKNRLDYNSKNLLNSSIKEFEKHFKFKKNNFNVALGNAVEPFTFGLEFETVKGNIPMPICKRLGLIPLRDGSISGLEYATIPYSGIKGIEALKESINVLKKYTEYDKDCSIHIHIGNVPRTESFITAFFKTTLIIQDQLYELFPLYKKENYGYKKKNYTAPYNPISFLLKMDNIIDDSNLIKNFGVIFKYLSNGKKYEDYNCSLDNVKSHPKDQEDNHKWHVNTRYHLHNIIPLIFGNKQTIEFRLHTSTFEYFKIFSFLLLNIAILKFVINNEKDILLNNISFEKLNIYSILKLVFGDKPELYEDIVYYFDHRRARIRDEYCIKNNFFFDEDSLRVQNPFRRYDKNKFRIVEQKTNFLNDFSNFLTLRNRNQNFENDIDKGSKYMGIIDESTGAIKMINRYTYEKQKRIIDDLSKINSFSVHSKPIGKSVSQRSNMELKNVELNSSEIIDKYQKIEKGIYAQIIENQKNMDF